jgi:penicillin amidase
LVGRVPIRAKGDGRVPVPGWTGEYEWLGYVPFEEMPHVYNPPSGYLATANNRVTGKEYAYFLGYDHCSGDRAQRIVELLDTAPRASIQQFKQMQFDLVSPTARVVARYLGSLPTSEARLCAVTQMMGEWDGTLDADSPAAAVYEVFMRRLLRLTLFAHLGDLTERYAGKGPTPVLADDSIFGHRSWEWLQAIMADPTSQWFDQGGGETRDDVMREAVTCTVDFLTSELGPSVSDWAWAKLHKVTFSHALGRDFPLDHVFNRGPFPVGGDGHTLWATGAGQHDLVSDAVTGPPFRFIADLGDLRNSVGMLVPGQSGHPGSRHYDDQVRSWFEGVYHPMLVDRADVDRESVSHLVLVPNQPSR